MLPLFNDTSSSNNSSSRSSTLHQVQPKPQLPLILLLHSSSNSSSSTLYQVQPKLVAQGEAQLPLFIQHLNQHLNLNLALASH